MVDDGSFIYVKPTEPDGPEEDSPDVGTDLLEADEVATEKLRDVDPSGLPSDPSIGGDFSDFEVSGVLEGQDLGGEGSGRGFVERSRWSLVVRFVGTNVVVVGDELVEAALLSGSVPRGRDGGLRLEVPMHALVSSVLVGRSRLDEFGQDAERDPPDRELGESGERVWRGEGHTVVGSDALGEPELLEDTCEDPLGV